MVHSTRKRANCIDYSIGVSTYTFPGGLGLMIDDNENTYKVFREDRHKDWQHVTLDVDTLEILNEYIFWIYSFDEIMREYVEVQPDE